MAQWLLDLLYPEELKHLVLDYSIVARRYAPLGLGLSLTMFSQEVLQEFTRLHLLSLGNEGTGGGTGGNPPFLGCNTSAGGSVCGSAGAFVLAALLVLQDRVVLTRFQFE